MSKATGANCPGQYDGNISASSLTTQASHSRAHGTHPCRALVATYFGVPTAFAWCDRGKASAPEQGRVARNVLFECAAKPDSVTSGLPACVTKISQNKRVRVGVDPACDRDQLGD